MKTVGELMASPAVTAAPSETVTAAVQRLREHDIGALPVVDDGRLVGIVTIKDLLGQPPYRLLREVMTPAVVTVPPTEPVTAAYALMGVHGVGRLPVVEDGRLLGIVTRTGLLRELGKLTDPLTELPWSGSLRQHGADLLKLGREIAVVFVDLDDFGIVNKLHGHVVGDRIIKGVAELLQSRIDPATDFLCRYAGDEFAIVTTRDLPGAEALAVTLREAIRQMAVPGAPPGVIGCSIGIAGGKRTQERQDVHYQATVDDLITMASRASTMAKRTEGHVLQETAAMRPPPVPEPEAPVRIVIRRIDLGVADGRGTATVEVEHDGRRATGKADGPVLGMSGLRLLVDATLAAVRQFLRPGWHLALEEVTRSAVGGTEALHIHLVSGTPGGAEQGGEQLQGSAVFRADPHEAAVKATLQAITPLLDHPQEVRV